MRKRDWAVLLAVILLAGAARFGYNGVRSFAFDEARLSLIAQQALDARALPAVGMPSSAGVPNMPAAAWLFMLPYSITSDPLAASMFVSALNVLAVWGVWRLARRWGLWAAWTAGAYIALNPFAVLYARSVWAQNLLIPMAVLWLVAADAAHADGPRRPLWIGLAAFMSGFALQVHFAGAALGLAGAFAFVHGRWWRHMRAVLIGGGLAALMMLPFVLTDGALRGLLDTAGGGSAVDAAALTSAARLLVAVDWAYLLHGEAELPLQRLTPAMMRGGLLLVATWAGAIGVILWLGDRLGVTNQADTDTPSHTNTPVPPRPLLPLALAVGVSPLLLFTYHSTPVFAHYLLPVIVTGAIALAWLTADARPRAMRLIITIAVTGATLMWGGMLERGMAVTQSTRTVNGMAEPLGTLRTVANTPDDGPLLFFTHGDDPNTQGEPSIFSALWWGRDDTRIIDGRAVLILPNQPATLLFTERAFQSWEELRERELLGELQPIPRREGAPTFELTRYDGETAPANITWIDPPIPFAHGNELMGWDVYQVGPRTRISTVWQANGPISANVQQFHHLYAGDTVAGEPFAVSDVSVRGASWHAGDTVIVMGDFFDLSPDTRYTVAVGHYTLPDLVRVPHANGDTVTLGTLTP